MDINVDDNEKELLKSLYDAYKASVTYGICESKLTNMKDVTDSLISKKMADFGVNMFSLTIIGLAYCKYDL